SGPTWLFDIDSLTRTMNYQPVTARKQTNPSAGFQDKFDAEKAGEEIDQQYVPFPVWSSSSTNPDGDVAFDGKEHDFDAKKPESEVSVSLSSSAQSRKQDDKTKKEAKRKNHVESFTRYRDLSAEFEDYFDNSINEVNAAGTIVPTVGQNSLNSTNTFSVDELEDITYSDDEDDVGAEADFNNLETSITVSPIPTTRVHKDHPVLQIIGDLSATIQTRSMTRVVKDQGKSASTPIDTEKPLLKDSNGEDVDVHTYSDSPLLGVNTPRCDEDMLELMELTVLLLPKVKKVRIRVNAVDLQVSAIRHMLLLLVQKLMLFSLTNWCCSLSVVRSSIDKKKVVVTEGTIREALHLDDAEGVDCLPNEEIFAELARMGYEKPSTKLTFYKAFFSSQWKKQVGDLSIHTTKYTSPALTQKVFANMRRVGKGFFRVETPLFESMLVEHEVDKEGDADEHVKEVNAGDAAEGDDSVVHGEFLIALEITKLKRRVKKLEIRNKDDAVVLEDDKEEDREVADAIKYVEEAKVDESAQDQGRQAESQAKIYKINMDHANKVLSVQEDETEPTEVQEVVDVVTTSKLITEAALEITKLKRRVKKLERRNKDAAVVLEDDKEEDREVADAIKDVEEAKVNESAQDQGRQAESQAEIYKIDMDNANKVLSMQEDETEPTEVQEVVDVVTTSKLITEAVRTEPAEVQEVVDVVTTAKLITEFVTTASETVTTASAIITARLNETPAERAAKRRKLDEEVEELKRHLQIVSNEDDDRDLEALWSLVKERFSTTKPKNFSDDFLLVTLGAMFEKLDIHAQIWKTQRNVHERKYPLTRFTLDQMLNAVRLEVDEESEVSLELLRFIRQQHQEGQQQ
nr:hypothetical protein [Tanacetum cinerariifolium]